MEEAKSSLKTKKRSDKEYKDLIHRLNRIEGQVRGIKGMVETDAYCTDILVQIQIHRAWLLSRNKNLRIRMGHPSYLTRIILAGQ